MADEVINTSETATENSEATTTATAASTEASTEEKSSNTEGDKVDLAKTGDEPKADDPKGDDPKGNDEVDARYGAPEGDAAYDIKLEGEAAIDADALALVTPSLKELNLSNDAATKLVGVFAEKVLPHYEDQFRANLEQTITTQRTEWEGAARDLIAGKDAAGEALVAKNSAGEVLGFDGNDIKGVQSTAARALDRLAPVGFRQFLEETGLAVHPQMVAFAYQVGKAIAEDGTFETTGKTPVAPSREEKFYG